MRDHVLAVALIAGLTACGSLETVRHNPNEMQLEPGGLVMDRAEIGESGANNAMEAVERAGSHLTFTRTRAGTPVRMTHRGVDSFLLNPEIMLVVDGTRVSDPVQMLYSIPAESIMFIQILSGREASSRFGSEAANGIILVQTSAR